MELKQVQIETRPSLTLPWNEVVLMPIGDVQCGVEACYEERLKRHIEWGLEHGAVFLGMGDYVDMASPSDRAKLRAVTHYDPVTAAINEKAEADVERFLGLVDGSKGRWLGMLQGHHYMQFADGTTSDTRIASALDTIFLGDCSIVTLDIGGVLADIWCHHGSGSTSSEAAVVTKLLTVAATWDVDVVLLGHHHMKVATKKPRPYVDHTTGHLAYRNRVLACTGSFLRGYLEGGLVEGRPGGTYVEKRMLSPIALGGIVVRMRPAYDREGGARLDLDVEL